MVTFRRILGGVLLDEWNHILHIVSTISFTHESDNVSWCWDANGIFTVRSFYKFLNFRGVQPLHPMIWWQLPVPPKLQAFMWLVTKHRILTKKNLQNKGWLGDITCEFCSYAESSNHLFFRCFYAKQVWMWMGQCHNRYHHWSSIEDVIQFACTLSRVDRIAFLIVVCAVIWSIWKHRNDLCFNNVRIYTARSLILQILSLITYWSGTIQGDIKQAIGTWTPGDLDVIPLQVVDPDDALMLEWVIGDEDEE